MIQTLIHGILKRVFSLQSDIPITLRCLISVGSTSNTNKNKTNI